MILKDIEKQLGNLYCTCVESDAIRIGTWYTIEGDPINFLFSQEDEKYSVIRTNDNFSEWMAWNTDGWSRKASIIEEIAAYYDVRWDNEHGRLFIRFRRNEMTVAQAIMRLLQAVFVIAATEF